MQKDRKNCPLHCQCAHVHLLIMLLIEAACVECLSSGSLPPCFSLSFCIILSPFLDPVLACADERGVETLVWRGSRELHLLCKCPATPLIDWASFFLSYKGWTLLIQGFLAREPSACPPPPLSFSGGLAAVCQVGHCVHFYLAFFCLLVHSLSHDLAIFPYPYGEPSQPYCRKVMCWFDLWAIWLECESFAVKQVAHVSSDGSMGWWFWIWIYRLYCICIWYSIWLNTENCRLPSCFYFSHARTFIFFVMSSDFCSYIWNKCFR